MGRFKEQGKEGISEMQENSKETTERGNEMNQQAEQIKSILESIELQDDEDMEAVSETGRNYQGSFDSAFTEQVESKGQEIGQQGEQLKGEMNQELENVRSGMSRLEQAGGVSEIGRDAAEAGRSKLESSSQEYEGMIEDTESVVDETEEKINSLKNNLSRIFG